MIVVADSSPLHYLILLEQTDLLRRLYEEVLIPDSVAAELRAAGSPPTVSEWMAATPSWLQVVEVSPRDIASVTDELDVGERAAIALAESARAELLLIDESAGRAEARRRRIRVTGTLGVLRIAADVGFIDVQHVLNRLQATNFYVDESLLKTIFSKWLEESGG